ncbi:hypothetical protein BH11CYA1_BH11CYA1_02560 [soil metagenome]
MKEVSSLVQSNDNAIVGIDKHNNTMGNFAADIWKDGSAMLGLKEKLNNYGTKYGLTNLQIDGLDTKPTKGGSGAGSSMMDALPNTPSNFDSSAKPFVKPEIPADGGPKYPTKDSIKDSGTTSSIECDLRRPIVPFIIEPGDYGDASEPVVKPEPKPSKPVKAAAEQGESLV